MVRECGVRVWYPEKWNWIRKWERLRIQHAHDKILRHFSYGKAFGKGWRERKFPLLSCCLSSSSSPSLKSPPCHTHINNHKKKVHFDYQFCKIRILFLLDPPERVVVCTHNFWKTRELFLFHIYFFSLKSNKLFIFESLREGKKVNNGTPSFIAKCQRLRLEDKAGKQVEKTGKSARFARKID